MQHTSELLRTRPFHFKMARVVRVSVSMGCFRTIVPVSERYLRVV